ncbi:MAG: N-acetylmuramoyl-L-alanine amidase, partial [Stackebrandtia sp.]
MTNSKVRPWCVALLAVCLAGCSYRPIPTGEDPASSAPPSPTAPLDGLFIALDAGHNGGNADHPEVIDAEVDAVTGDKPCDTTGTQTDDGYFEHEFTFDVTRRLSD